MLVLDICFSPVAELVLRFYIMNKLNVLGIFINVSMHMERSDDGLRCSLKKYQRQTHSDVSQWFKNS